MRVSDTGGMASLKGTLSRGLGYRARRPVLQIIGFKNCPQLGERQRDVGSYDGLAAREEKREDVKKRASVLLAYLDSRIYPEKKS